MSAHPRTLFLVAGEASGDMRAAPLVQETLAARPGTRVVGIAGPRCRKAGMTTFADIRDLSVMGFAEVIRHYPRLKAVFEQTLSLAKETRPDVALLVDYPGFNLRLAAELKRLGTRVVFYVSPQVWAWKQSRIHLIRRVVDRMMVFFPFERDLYARFGYKADWVGHPLVDEVQADMPRDLLLRNLGLSPDRPVLGLLPGSRPQEVHNHLPAMMDAADRLRRSHPGLQVLLLKAKGADDALFSPFHAAAAAGTAASDDFYNALAATDAALVASGTAALETGIMQKPMVVVYRTAWLTSVIVRLLIRIPYISLVNIVSEKKIVQELLQQDVNGERMAREITGLIGNTPAADAMRADLARLREKLGAPGASRRAAAIVLEELDRRVTPSAA